MTVDIEHQNALQYTMNAGIKHYTCNFHRKWYKDIQYRQHTLQTIRNILKSQGAVEDTNIENVISNIPM